MGQFGGGLSSIVTWGHRQRSLRRLLKGGRAIGRCFLMSGLSTVLKDVANTKFSERSITCEEGASAASPRKDGATGNAGCTIEVALTAAGFFFYVARTADILEAAVSTAPEEVFVSWASSAVVRLEERFVSSAWPVFAGFELLA